MAMTDGWEKVNSAW